MFSCEKCKFGKTRKTMRIYWGFPGFKARSSSYKYKKYKFFEDKIKFHEVDLPMTMDCAAMKKDFLTYFEDLHLEITKRKSFFLLF